MFRKRIKTISYFLAVYMLLAFSWWAVLLHNKNEENFNANVEALRLNWRIQGIYENEKVFSESLPYETIHRDYRRQERMIIGEAIVILLSLGLGLIAINRNYQLLYRTERSKQNFLLAVSHELKSPIASIKLAFETLRKAGLNESQRRDVISDGLGESERLHKLVDNALLATSLDIGYNLQYSVFDIRTVLNEVIKIVQKQYPNTEISLDLENFTPSIYSDKTALTAILLNLVENGAKYGGDPPAVKVSVSETEKFEIKVSDNGEGIPVKERDKVFGKFYRAGSENTRRTKGTGLGLYLVSKLVKILRGEISILDNNPSGTVFIIQLPKQPKDANTAG